MKLNQIAELSDLAKAEGKRTIPVITNATPRDPKAIEKLEEMGVTLCLFGLKAAPTEKVLPRLDKLAGLPSF